MRSEVAQILVPGEDQVASNLKLSQNDCGARTENTPYALNQVRQGNITPRGLEISRTKNMLQTKLFQKNCLQQNIEYSVSEKMAL